MKSLMKNLSEKDIEAMLNVMNLNGFYFPSLFPFRFTGSLTWKALSADQGVPVAADVVSYNASAPRKTRQIVAKAQGDIPKISVAREKNESELNDYFQLLNYAKTTDGAEALIKFVYDDIEFCWNGVAARLEWLALRALSTGKVSLDVANNNGVITENAIEFLVPSAQKKGVTTAWSVANKATCTPIADIRTIVGLAKKKGILLSYMLMNQDTFDVFSASTEVVNFASAWVLKATNLTTTPSLVEINRALKESNVPEIKVLESYVTIEKNDGTQTTVNPWETGAVTFLPSLVPGNTWYAPLADEIVQDGSAAMKVKRGATLIKKYAVEEPLTEVTIGMANAFPAWGSASRSYMLDTLHTTFTF